MHGAHIDKVLECLKSILAFLTIFLNKSLSAKCVMAWETFCEFCQLIEIHLFVSEYFQVIQSFSEDNISKVITGQKTHYPSKH